MKQVTLRFLRFHCLDRFHCSVQYHQLIDGVIERFEKTNPHIKIESIIMRNWYQLMYTLKKKLPTGESPDVFHTCGGGELEELTREDLVYDLTDALNHGWRQTFIPASLHPLRFNDREYAVPLEQGFIFVWYNKKIFEKFGLSVPRTFDELLIICRELSRCGIVPFAVGNNEKWPGAFFFSHLFHRIGGGEVFVSDFTKAPNYADIKESFISAAEKLLKLVEAGAFHEDAGFTNYEQQRMMFVQGEAAMQLNGNRLLDYIKVEGPQILDHVGTFPFPLVKDGKGTTSTVFGGSLATYAISARSQNKDEAILFLKSLTDEFAARDIIYKMGDIPAPKYVAYDEYPSLIHSNMAKKLGEARKVHVHYFKYLSPHPAGVYLNIVARLFAREISPDDAFHKVEEALYHSSAKNAAHKKGLSI